jgi:uncharacterized membrane protein YkoI
MSRSTLIAAAFVALIAASAGAQQPKAAAKPTKEQAAKPTKEQAAKEEAALRASAKVSEDSARKIALKAVPGGTVKAAEVEKENGKLIWSMELTVAGKKGIEEVNIDAMTGKVIAKEHESDAKEAKEAKDEAKAKAAKPNAPVRKP